jgi:hypothetical protein
MWLFASYLHVITFILMGCPITVADIYDDPCQKQVFSWCMDDCGNGSSDANSTVGMDNDDCQQKVVSWNTGGCTAGSSSPNDMCTHACLDDPVSRQNPQKMSTEMDRQHRNHTCNFKHCTDCIKQERDRCDEMKHCYTIMLIVIYIAHIILGLLLPVFRHNITHRRCVTPSAVFVTATLFVIAYFFSVMSIVDFEKGVCGDWHWRAVPFLLPTFVHIMCYCYDPDRDAIPTLQRNIFETTQESKTKKGSFNV